jgi:hypothetical protein
MPRRPPPPPTDADAVQRARAWLDRQHDRAHQKVLRLLCETPPRRSARPLTSSAPASCALSRHLTSATRAWLDHPPPNDAGEDR